MKSKEEIEKLADEYSEIGKEAGLTFKEHTLENIAFINGYTQCQEDISKLLEKAIEFGYQLRNNNKPINSGIDWVKEFNSLD